MNDKNQCPSTKAGFHCHKLNNGHDEHHDIVMGERWRGEEPITISRAMSGAPDAIGPCSSNDEATRAAVIESLGLPPLHDGAAAFQRFMDREVRVVDGEPLLVPASTLQAERDDALAEVARLRGICCELCGLKDYGDGCASEPTCALKPTPDDG